ncbi:uncharacterized protein LOC129606987 isoform X2 [Condylostylus longicornis]|uniref:uncharacterized protein LOC129606987 isoform X2 n=1 Tax=Condylostylus longicornis TaxID=2530218 RepID=UPI00244DC605|nr:uncharacterized protein LOC129606987 isoform X2 [Condylostylus longicornis]
MVDSGFDSEEKLSSILYEKDQEDANKAYESDDEDESSSNNSLEITFRGTNDYNKQDNELQKLQKQQQQQQPQQPFKVIKNSQLNSCRILQRKLELKVERAKKTYNQYQEVENAKKNKSSNLIPINRLQIPGYSENQPLVDYKSDSNDDDDVEEISFFPSSKSKNSTKQVELNTDTFSIQEMTIESDNNSDDSGSQNLELLPPLQNNKFLDKLLNCFYCNCFEQNNDLP